ncbi:cuticle collagen 2-like [Ovis aries]|uniref:cuticle collagen 2-like n=1 Tax=Ovis aries TaxID=9940 RepID=UPI0029528015|nr:cuticle collagen 2-like [Ovis aries]
MAPAPGCGAAGRAAGGRGPCGRRPDRGSTPSRPLRAPPREEAGASASCSPVPQPYPSPATTGSRKPTGCARQAGAGVHGSQSGVGRRPRPSLPAPSSRISETNGRLYPRGSHCGDWTAGYERGAAFYKKGTEGGGAAESPALSRRASSTLRPPGSASPAPARQRLAPALLGMNPAGLRTWDGDRERLGPLPFGVESLLEAERWLGSEPVQPQEERPRGAAESRAWFPPAAPSSVPRKCPVARSRAARGARLAQARRTRARKALSFVTSEIAIY